VSGVSSTAGVPVLTGAAGLPTVGSVPTTPPSSVPGPGLDQAARRASARVLASLGAATRPEDGEPLDPLDFVRQAQQPAGRHRASRHRPRVVTVPSRVRLGRFRVSRPAVIGVVVVVLLVAGLGGVRVAWAVRDSRPEVVTADPTSALEQGELSRQAETASADDAGAVGSPTVEPQLELIVHVAGQVKSPGIVRLAPGGRVIDAIEGAGGATAEADLALVNLARPVVDGEQVYVPAPGELPPASASGGGAGAGAGGGGNGPGDGVIDLNTADAAALDALPGVGPVLAERIIDWRTEHGRFTSVEELAEVSGIGEKLLSRLRDKVRVG